MAYVFGTTFVCDGMDNAKKVQRKRKHFFVKEKNKKTKLQFQNGEKQTKTFYCERKKQENLSTIKRKQTNLIIQNW